MKYLILTLSLLFVSQTVSAQDFALQQLEDSPRHQEWVEVKDGDRTIHSFVVYPEVSENAMAVIVIHENRGLTDWVRSFADQLAAEGYIAIAPDLLSQFDENYQRTRDFESSDAARDALYQLEPQRITQDLMAVQNYVTDLPAATGEVVVAGFCWGGSQSFRYATNADGLSAALVFYGSATTDEDRIRNISSPVYGFYGGDDQRINSTIPETSELMEKHDKTYIYNIYEGAGHGYMRTGDAPDAERANKTARDSSWEWIRDILSDL
ncbi:dienelactone hydrolase family protein [Rhodohalobacter barkolensis]|uniref:Carboxymethylenebutenolidase n=1 Tax=Rhodohalobacter barkolensis TaxID=2053187 RepID=A0A2N0VI66_9BACT|nr:dienelactone hydrolase family protein [Rhodohalobacter barkolensis]PKD43854.1 carboxymethylenebutenolidase [Rhodohalobacter barkolensis]